MHLLQWNIAISKEWKDRTELVDDLYDANKNSTVSVQINISFHFVFAFLLLPQVTWIVLHGTSYDCFADSEKTVL